MQVICEVKEGKHQPPGIFSSSNWQKVHVCQDCGHTIGEKTLINCYEPCHNCGGSYSGLKSYTGKWDKKTQSWIKRVSIKKN